MEIGFVAQNMTYFDKKSHKHLKKNVHFAFDSVL